MQDVAVNDYVLHGKDGLEKSLAGFPPVWCTEEIIGMIRWMRSYNANPAHEKKIKFYGIETGESKTAVTCLQKYLEKVDPVAVKEFEKSFSFLGKTDAYEMLIKYSAKEYEALQEIFKRFLVCFDRGKANYVARSSQQEWEKARQSVCLLQQFAESYFIPGNNDYLYLNLRARFMAENTQWILDTEPPDTKIMLWAHNFHISLSPYPGYPFIFMGMHLRRMLGNDYLAVGFEFNRGSFQGLDFTSPNREHNVVKSFTVGPYPGSYSLAMSRTGLRFFFLDLRRVPGSGIVHDWFFAPQVFKSIDSIYANEKDIQHWFKVPVHFDAVIFFENTTRAHPNPNNLIPRLLY